MIIARRVAINRANRRIVVILYAASEGIGEQFFGGRSQEIVAVFRQEQLAQPGRTLELGPIGQLPARVDRRARILAAPPPDGVVILRSEERRVGKGGRSACGPAR